MTEWLKILIPVFITGASVIVYALFEDVRSIEDKQNVGQVYIYRLEKMELRLDKLEARECE